MYYTLKLQDVACAAVILIGFIVLAKWVPKKGDVIVGLTSSLTKYRKLVYVYLGILVAMCAALALPSALYFANGAKLGQAESLATSVQTSTSTVDLSEVDPPQLKTLLTSGNESRLVEYIQRLGNTGANTSTGWLPGNIRLDHEGARPQSSFTCTSSSNTNILDLRAVTAPNAFDQGTLNFYVAGLDTNSIMKQIESELELPAYHTNTVNFMADQPYEDSRGLMFECDYNINIPWKISGTIHKADTCNGEDVYNVNITLVRYITA